ncbi:hypothetical protein DB42_CT00050 [Neochlamydia sp. EPS4]|nr:hypothetical protein DB42_CT00050 [Neochlamydia sp. EPS4]
MQIYGLLIFLQSNIKIQKIYLNKLIIIFCLFNTKINSKSVIQMIYLKWLSFNDFG